MGCCSKEKKGKDLPKTNRISSEIKKKKKPVEQLQTKISKEKKIVAVEAEENVRFVSIPKVKNANERSRVQIEQWIDELPSEENICSIKTFDELKSSVENHSKAISLVLFYGHYCPYSKRTVAGLRQWARTNRQRIDLYEIDVEVCSTLSNFYHVKTIPTVMAFSEKNLLAPIWQRTANQVLPSDEFVEPMKIDDNENENENEEKAIEEIFRGKLNRSMNFSFVIDANEISPIEQTENSHGDEQFLIIRKDPKSPSKFIVSISTENAKKNDFVRSAEDPWKIRSNYQWPIESNRSEFSSEKTLSDETKYDGRLSSQTTSTSKEKCRNDVDSPNFINDDEYQQNVHLPNTNELFYEKKFDEIQRSFSFDRLSTLTYEQTKNAHEEICVLFLGPHGVRGFEENRANDEQMPSKLSLLTLKSHSFAD